jgi:hypothetical protein
MLLYSSHLRQYEKQQSDADWRNHPGAKGSPPFDLHHYNDGEPVSFVGNGAVQMTASNRRTTRL